MMMVRFHVALHSNMLHQVSCYCLLALAVSEVCSKAVGNSKDSYDYRAVHSTTSGRDSAQNVHDAWLDCTISRFLCRHLHVRYHGVRIRAHPVC